MTSVSLVAVEDQRARVAAQLGGVDADRVEQVERLVEQRAARHRELQRPAGLGADPASRSRPLPVRVLLAPGRRGRAPGRARSRPPGRSSAEALQQVVVAAAAADHVAERRVVDLEDRAACSSRGRAAGRGRSGRGRRRRAASSASQVSPQPRGRALDRRRRRARAPARAPRGRRAAARARRSVATCSSPSRRASPSSASRPTRSWRREALEDRARAASPSTPSSASSWR